MRTHVANQQLEQFRWLKRNLELQLEDIEFERRGKKIALYFDTANVQPAVLGLSSYYDGRHFSVDRFRSREATVNCLLASMLLGRFSMLPPHLSEFDRKVDSEFGNVSRKWDTEALKFLTDAGLFEDANELLKLSSEEETKAVIDRMSNKKVKRLASEEVRIAQLWFNAINCLLPWQRRLKLWLENDYFVVEDLNLNYSDLINSQRFVDIKDQLDAQRPGTTINNFVDAASISYLLHLTAELNAGNSDHVPRFYVRPRDTTFHGAIQALNIEGSLVCRTDGVTKPGSSVFRDADYFVFRLTFRPLQNASDGEGASASAVTPDYEVNLKRLYEKVSNSIDETRGLSDEQVKQYAEGLNDVYDGKSLKDLITELKRISFIEKNWFRTKMAKDLLEIIEQMRQVRGVVESQRYIYENERLRRAVLEVFKNKKKALNDSLEEFRWVSTLWDPLYRGAELLKKRRRMLEVAEQGDIFRDLGLLRYNFPANTHKAIKDILGGLCSGEADQMRNAIQKTIKAYVLGRKMPEQQSANLIVTVAILVAARLNENLIELLKHVRGKTPLPHHSLKIAYAELLFRAAELTEDAKELSEAEQLVETLEEEYSSTGLEGDRPHLAVGLAYLYYRSWRIRHGLADWYESQGLRQNDACRQVDARPIIEKAILSSREAYESLDSDDLSKKAYALNQVLYYSVEGCGPVSYEEYQPLARKLFLYRFRQRIWQYRFDDTLARYYLRLFLNTDSIERKREFIKRAKDHVEAAISRSGDDDEVKTFQIYLEQVELEFKLRAHES
jgi:hypothetical protein